MDTLPPSTDYTSSSTTQAGAKTFIATMRDFVQNLSDFAARVTSSAGSLKLPVGPTASRDETPDEGYLRGNSELKKFEGYLNGRWQDVGGGQMLGNATVKAVFFGSTTINENVNVVAGTNAMTPGPISITPGHTVTMEPGTCWRIV